MCESFRNAFREILQIYDGLRKAHPEPAIKNGVLKIEDGQDLVNERFVTRQGLTLMGPSALKGNVYLRVDGRGRTVAEGIDALNVFVFKGHWTLKVNGREYDPIFHTIDQKNVALLLNEDYTDGTVQFLANIAKPTKADEFGSTWVEITDVKAFKKTLASLVKIHGKMKSGKEAKAKKKAGKLVKADDRAAFAKLVDLAYNSDKATRDEWKAVKALLSTDG